MKSLRYKCVNFRLEYDEMIEKFNMTKTHLHNEYELYLLHEGERVIFIKNTSFYITNGMFALFDALEPHKVFSLSDKPHSRLLICFDKKFTHNVLPNIEHVFLGSAVSFRKNNIRKQWLKLIDSILEEAECNNIQKDNMLDCLIRQLLIFLRRNTENFVVSTNYGNEKLRKIISYINENYVCPPSLVKICEHFEISVSHFTHLMRETTGFSYIEYVNDCRIKDAIKRLAGTKDKISMIAQNCGFDSFAYFSKIFKRTTGLSPREYRILHNQSFLPNVDR